MNRFREAGEIKIYHFLATFTVNRSRCSNTNHLIWTGPCLVIIPSSWANVRCRWDFRQIKGPAAIVLFPFLRCLKTEKYILIFLRCEASFLLKTVGEEQPLRIASKDLGARVLNYFQSIHEYIYIRWYRYKLWSNFLFKEWDA